MRNTLLQGANSFGKKIIQIFGTKLTRRIERVNNEKKKK